MFHSQFIGANFTATHSLEKSLCGVCSTSFINCSIYSALIHVAPTGKGRTCDIIHIVKLDDNHESAFLIQDMFPISEKYIEREYTIAGNHLRLTSEHAAKEIEQKARKVLGMLKRGIKFTPTKPDIQKIYERLQQDLPATHL